MLISIFGQGLLLGVAIAAPVGPIGLLCIRRTLARGHWVGWMSGCGAATADACYGAIAAFGLNVLKNQFDANSFYLQLAGGLFLCYLGVKTFFTQPLSSSPGAAVPPNRNLLNGDLLGRDPLSKNLTQPAVNSAGVKGLVPAYATTFALTLANPTTIASFIGIFSGLGITQGNYRQSVTLVSGVFSGSLLWWLVLVSAVAYLRSRLTSEGLNRFNWFSSKVFGIALVGFGIAALVTLP